MRPLSLTARISLLFAVAAAAVLLATGVFLARAVEAHFIEGDRHELDGKLELIRHLVARVDGPAALDHLPGQLDDALVGHHGLAVAVVDARGHIWFATSGADFPRRLLRAGDCASDAGLDCLEGGLRQWRQGGHDYRGRVALMRAGDGALHTVAVALDIGHHQRFMDEFHFALGLAMTLATLATAGLGWAATRRGLAPLRQITELAAGLSADHLGRRLPESGLPGELRTLVSAFNAMLARLDDSFRRLSEFSSDIAHELRTPISNLMTQTQVALGRARSAGEYREVLQSSAEEYERLARMIADMLFLARGDNRQIAPAREAVDLAALARDLIEFHGPVAEEAGLDLELRGAASVQGDRLMLRRALSNLLSNAIRHSPEGGRVRLELVERADAAVIGVENPGRIPAEHLPRLFDRFFTGDPARRAGGEGAGLGLAIVRAIAQLHGGRVQVEAADGRVRFEITLPRAPLARADAETSAPGRR